MFTQQRIVPRAANMTVVLIFCVVFAVVAYYSFSATKLSAYAGEWVVSDPNSGLVLKFRFVVEGENIVLYQEKLKVGIFTVKGDTATLKNANEDITTLFHVTPKIWKSRDIVFRKVQ